MEDGKWGSDVWDFGIEVVVVKVVVWVVDVERRIESKW